MRTLNGWDVAYYVVSIVLCAVTYLGLNRNIEWSLLPHKTVLEYWFGFRFVFVENVGYEQSHGLFIIAQNCLGVKLFISLFLILVLGFLHKYKATQDKIAAVVRFYFGALVLAFFATVVRISVSVPFCTWDQFYLIHNTISLVIYFAVGLVLYFVMERRLRAE